ncbi:DNA-directed RNA polymerase III subunit Rpc5 [Amylostereum chailletii]|nr:DNA-directed RNA polymerase III subunit Rpc5 [Amylostereum chailletii]
MDTQDDPVVSVLPIHLSSNLAPNVLLHQFPLLNRPLQVPPSAALSGKRIRARIKPQARRLEIHVPVDSRPEVWNAEKSKDLGVGRSEDDKEKNQETGKAKLKEGDEPRLSELRLRSEELPRTGAYMLGVVRNGHLHLHPVAETHQLRPTLTYLDALSKKSKRSRGGGGWDSDSDEGPPPDPDEALPPPVVKKEKKPTGEARDVQVAARKSEGQNLQGGLSTVRREMLVAIHAEEDEVWTDFEFHDAESAESAEAYEAIFSQHFEDLDCTTDVTTFLKSIPGL